jgi:signal transduction histidine kinase
VSDRPAERRDVAGTALVELTLAERELLARVQWLISLRWLAAPGLVGGGAAALYFLRGPVEARSSLLAVAGLGAFVGLYNLLLLLSWRRYRPGRDGLERGRAALFAHLQIGLDLAALMAFVALTGGYASPFLAYYVLHMVLASILLSPRAAYLWALVGTVQGGILILLTGPPESFRFAPEGISVSGLKLLLCGGFACLLHVSVYLATSIVTRLRSRQEEAQQLLVEVRTQAALLTDAYERLQATQHMQTAYMRRVSHELRSPLAAITTSLEVVRDGYAGPVPEAAAEMVARAHERIAQLLRMVEDLLALSRAHAGKPREYLERVSVPAVVEEVLRLQAERAEKRRIELRDATPADLPAVLADREEMVQLITNLTANAIKYSCDGTRVSVSACVEDGFVVIRVADQGIGIPAEDLPHIFEEFYRSRLGRQHAAIGTGLGLSIVRTIARQLGGEVTAESEVGVGTTFAVRLPIDGPDLPGA